MTRRRGLLVTGVTLALLLGAGAAPAPSNRVSLTPTQIAAFKSVKTVRIEVKEMHVKTAVTIEADVRRVAAAMFEAVGWRVAGETDRTSDAALRMTVTGGIIENPGTPTATAQSPARRASAAAKLMGQYALRAGRVMLVGRMNGQGTDVAEGDRQPTAHAAMLRAMLGSGFLESLTKTLATLRDVPASQPVAALATDENPDVRQYAARVLGSLGEIEGVEPLLGLMGDRAPRVVSEADQAFGKVRDPKAVERLLAHEAGAKDDRTRDACRRAIFHVGVPAIEPLIAALKGADAERRVFAVGLLKELVLVPEVQGAPAVGPGRFVKPLVEAISNPDADIRRGVVESLRLLGHKAALPALEQRAAEDADAAVREAARGAVDHLRKHGWEETGATAPPS